MADTDTMHTLRLIYADLTEKEHRCRAKAEQYTRGDPENAVLLRCKEETYASAASVVRRYCLKIGFDPSTKGEQK